MTYEMIHCDLLQMDSFSDRSSLHLGLLFLEDPTPVHVAGLISWVYVLHYNVSAHWRRVHCVLATSPTMSGRSRLGRSKRGVA